jgi:hypothetical protein
MEPRFYTLKQRVVQELPEKFNVVGSIFTKEDTCKSYDLMMPFLPPLPITWPIGTLNTGGNLQPTTPDDWQKAYAKWPEYAPKYYQQAPTGEMTEEEMNNWNRNKHVAKPVVAKPKQTPQESPKLEGGVISPYYQDPKNPRVVIGSDKHHQETPQEPPKFEIGWLYWIKSYEGVYLYKEDFYWGSEKRKYFIRQGQDPVQPGFFYAQPDGDAEREAIKLYKF